jgi:hypothetical protein
MNMCSKKDSSVMNNIQVQNCPVTQFQTHWILFCSLPKSLMLLKVNAGFF